MRKSLRWALSLSVLIGTVAPTGVATAADTDTDSTAVVDSQSTDIKDRILAIPGMSLIEEKPYAGYRFFVLNYKQPIDHRRPWAGTFDQRISVLHKDTGRPTVFRTSGYSLSTTPSRAEPTRIVDGNQVSMEYRFFTPSRPQPADWSKLDIWQAASDQHRIFTALKKIYGQKWLSTGASKGGMTATYFERFYPRDMDGVVAYVAPNDVVNNEDSAYDRFFETVGTKECRDRLNNLQREALVRRAPLEAKYQAWAESEGATFNTVGTLDKAFEAVVLDFVWGFWQYYGEDVCDQIPDAKTASDDVVYETIDAYSGWSAYTDQGLEGYTPYYYQAATQLGSPTIKQPHLKGLSRYGYQPARNFVPREIPMKFQPHAMRDVDSWVRNNANKMLFVYGGNDPWGSEKFHLGKGARDSYVYVAPGANHGANVAGLVDAERENATARILAWAGVPAPAVQAAQPLARFDARLDRQVDEDATKEHGLRP
ncbi:MULTISPECIES: alpha/beta hydrolase family protein [Streptomyces]|uniref:Secreted tripeptidyl aminopeptidase n=1 Tax=Streptomyces venezuelae (strain ATCC 10712 / CBS 650.69 / DSM 40230 / JCM 4526 / NBRC 13096 / PD 04745) TaxID=953739 RepID=F2R3J3_STRVP|nr:S28 family serine protease [Streptomyces venezuelae]APE21759.1 aminopeptidase [Streptomyces venezuelae]QER99145.1 aminopeptidase [Streptomyces venezuelae ATCC 10712]QES06218.1 aminopeptidase [Streptomyces venezuelae]CCA55835.1 secreted tripeptidyl aminopeptidase [Streptomyces venezuelae ATCC 10712]